MDYVPVYQNDFDLFFKAAKMEEDLLWIYSLTRETHTHNTNPLQALELIEDITYNYLH